MKSFALAFKDVGFEGAVIHARIFQFGRSIYAPSNMQDAPTGLVFLKCDAEESPFKDWTMITDTRIERNTIATAMYMLGSNQLQASPITEDDKAFALGHTSDSITHSRWLALSDLLDAAITEDLMGKMIGEEK